jgi:hypothetical protein
MARPGVALAERRDSALILAASLTGAALLVAVAAGQLWHGTELLVLGLAAVCGLRAVRTD